MLRLLSVLLLLLGSVSLLSAQDMPLSEIIIPGENWQRIMVAKHKAPPGYSVTSKQLGFTYSTDPEKKGVVILVGEQKPQRLEVPLEKPTGLALIHNDGTLVVADAASKNLWAFRIKQDGKLDAGEKYYSLRVRKSDTSAETTAVIADTRDRIYAATKEGLQVFDPTGRLCGVLMIPTTDPILSMNFEGEKLERLRIVTANEGYVRKVIANVPPPMPKKK